MGLSQGSPPWECSGAYSLHTHNGGQEQLPWFQGQEWGGASSNVATCLEASKGKDIGMGGAQVGLPVPKCQQKWRDVVSPPNLSPFQSCSI